MALAGERLLADGYEDFGYLFVVGEEVDHIGAIEAAKVNTAVERIILCEPTLNRVARAQKGMVRFELVARGIAGHSAYPEKGESAIDKLLDAIASIRGESWPSDGVLGPTTVNFGTIEGGVAANVFAPSARSEALMRAVSPVEPIIASLGSMADHAGVEFRVIAANDPVFYDPPEDVAMCTVAFNTDATYLNSIGSVWLVGPGDIQCAHSIHEHISIESLLDAIDLYASLALKVLGS